MWMLQKKMWFEIIEQVEWPIQNNKEEFWTGSNIMNRIEPRFIIGFDFGFLILKDTQNINYDTYVHSYVGDKID